MLSYEQRRERPENCFLNRRSQVRVLSGPPFCFACAQRRIYVLGNQARLTPPHRHGADRARGPAADFERKADEFEPALADDLIEVDETLDMGESHVAADVVDLEIVAPRPARAHRFDPEHGDALPAE